MAGTTRWSYTSRSCSISPSLISSSKISHDRMMGQTCRTSMIGKHGLTRCMCHALITSSISCSLWSTSASRHLLPCPLDAANVQYQQSRVRQQLSPVAAAVAWQPTCSSSIGSRSAEQCRSLSSSARMAGGSTLNSSPAASNSRQVYYSEPQQQQLQQAVQQQWDQPNSSTPAGAKSRLLQQRQAQVMHRQQQQWQQQGQQEGEEGLIAPRPRSVPHSYSQYFKGDWWTARAYQDTSALHAAILERCGRGQLEVAALRHLIQTAASKRDAQLVLSALQAVRSVAVARQNMAPWDDAFLKSFVKMTATCDAPEALVSAMQRTNALGLVFKWKSLLMALKHWGDANDVDSLEAIVFALEAAGVRPNSSAAYVLVRAYVNAGQSERVDGVLLWFKQRGVTRFKPAMWNLMKKAGLDVAGVDQTAVATPDSSDDDEILEQ